MKKNVEKNKFAQIMKTIFVKDIGYKLFAIGFGLLLWFLMVGL